MSDHPNEPDPARLDGMSGTWSFLKGLLDEMPRYPRISVHAEAIATAEPKVRPPALEVDLAPPIELVVELSLEPTAESLAPALTEVLGERPRELVSHPATVDAVPPRRHGSTARVLPLRRHRSSRAPGRAGRRLVA